jgi:hypothetical protein
MLLFLPGVVRDYQLVDQNVVFSSGMFMGAVEKQVLKRRSYGHVKG